MKHHVSSQHQLLYVDYWVSCFNDPDVPLGYENLTIPGLPCSIG